MISLILQLNRFSICWVTREFVKSAKYQISYFNPVGMLTSIPQNAVTLKEQLPSQLTLHTLYSSSKILTTGALVHKMYQFSHYVTPKMVKRLLSQ